MVLLALLQLGALSASAPALAEPNPCPGATRDDVVVCGSRRGESPYRLSKVPGRYERRQIRPESDVIRGVHTRAHVDSQTLPDGYRSNRVMVTPSTTLNDIRVLRGGLRTLAQISRRGGCLRGCCLRLHRRKVRLHGCGGFLLLPLFLSVLIVSIFVLLRLRDKDPADPLAFREPLGNFCRRRRSRKQVDSRRREDAT